MEIRNFETDLNDSLLLKEEWIKVFKKAFGDDITIDFKDDKTSQFDFGVDTIITTKQGRRFTVEFKTKNFKYAYNNLYPFEIVRHIYSDEEMTIKLQTVPGWLYKGTFDYVFFGTLNKEKNKIIEVIGFSSIPFKLEEFRSNYKNFRIGFAGTRFRNGNHQKTIIKIVSTDFIKQNSIKFWYWKENDI